MYKVGKKAADERIAGRLVRKLQTSTQLEGPPDVIETTADSKRALAYSGVLKASTKLPTHKTAHSAMDTLGAEPSRLGGRGHGF